MIIIRIVTMTKRHAISNSILWRNYKSVLFIALIHSTLIVHTLFKCILLSSWLYSIFESTQLRWIDLFLDQLFTNWLLCRLRHDSLYFFCFLRRIPRIYMERRRGKATQRKIERERKIQSKRWGRTNPTPKNRREYSWEKMMSGKPVGRERKHGLCVISIKIGDYHSKVYPSFVIHPI